MPSTNQPPSPSIVKAPATRNDSPLARYAVSSASVGRANFTVVVAEFDFALWSAPSRSRIVQCPVYNTPERPRHGVPLPPRVVNGVRLPAQRTVDEQHRITADHNTIRRHCRVEVGDDLFGLCGCECVGDIARRGVGTLRGEDGILVHAGDDDDGIDSGLAQHHSPTG